MHVYGKLQQTTSLHRDTDASQHRGIGKKLMSLAEQIAQRDQREQIKVIAGEGTKRYYKNWAIVKETMVIW